VIDDHRRAGPARGRRPYNYHEVVTPPYRERALAPRQPATRRTLVRLADTT
jgi:hypothetical protein